MLGGIDGCDGTGRDIFGIGGGIPFGFARGVATTGSLGGGAGTGPRAGVGGGTGTGLDDSRGGGNGLRGNAFVGSSRGLGGGGGPFATFELARDRLGGAGSAANFPALETGGGTRNLGPGGGDGVL